MTWTGPHEPREHREWEAAGRPPEAEWYRMFADMEETWRLQLKRAYLSRLLQDYGPKLRAIGKIHKSNERYWKLRKALDKVERKLNGGSNGRKTK